MNWSQRHNKVQNDQSGHVINTKADEADDTEFHNLCK